MGTFLSSLGLSSLGLSSLWLSSLWLPSVIGVVLKEQGVSPAHFERGISLPSQCFASHKPWPWSNLTVTLGETEPQYFEWNFSVNCWLQGNSLNFMLDSFPEGLEAYPNTDNFPELYVYHLPPFDGPRDLQIRIPLDVSKVPAGEYHMNVRVTHFLEYLQGRYFPVTLTVVDPNSPTDAPTPDLRRYPFRVYERFEASLMGPDDEAEFVDQSYHIDMINHETRGELAPFEHRFTIANGDWATPGNWVLEANGNKFLKCFIENSNVTLYTLGEKDIEAGNLAQLVELLTEAKNTTQAHKRMVLNSQIRSAEESEQEMKLAVYPTVWVPVGEEMTRAGEGQALSVQWFAALTDEMVKRVGADSIADLFLAPAATWVPEINAVCDNVVQTRYVDMCVLLLQGGPAEEEDTLEKVLANEQSSLAFILKSISANFKVVVTGGTTDREIEWHQPGRLIIQGPPRGTKAADFTLTVDRNNKSHFEAEVQFTPLLPAQPQLLSKSRADVSVRVQSCQTKLEVEKIQPDLAGGSIAQSLWRGRDPVSGGLSNLHEGTLCAALADAVLLSFSDLADAALVPTSYCQYDIVRPRKMAGDELAVYELQAVLRDHVATPLCLVKLEYASLVDLLKLGLAKDLLSPSSTLTYVKRGTGLVSNSLELRGKKMSATDKASIVLPETLVEEWLMVDHVECYADTLSSVFTTWSLDNPATPSVRVIDAQAFVDALEVRLEQVTDAYTELADSTGVTYALKLKPGFVLPSTEHIKLSRLVHTATGSEIFVDLATLRLPRARVWYVVTFQVSQPLTSLTFSITSPQWQSNSKLTELMTISVY